MRVRLLQIVALGALALVAAGTARGTAAAPTPSTLTVEPRGGHYAYDPRRLSIVVDLSGESAAPGRITLQAPRQFRLGPERTEGAPIGRAEIYLRSGSGSRLRYTGTISAAPIEAAAACSADSIVGAWVIRASLGAKKLQLAIALDSGDGTRLDLCPAPGMRVAALALSLEGVRTPATPGSYRWSAFVTPRVDPDAAYELRAVVPVPHVLTLRGSYRSATRRVVLTGTLRSRGKPRQRAEIDIVRLDRTVFPLAFYDSWDGFVNTTARGTYSIALPLLRTQGFVASTPATLMPCTGTSTAPGGCKTMMVAGTESDPVTVSVP